MTNSDFHRSAESATEPRRFGKYSKVIRERDDTIQALCRQMERIEAEKDAEIERLKMGRCMTDDQIKHMADRFLGWKLPDNFNPDGGVSFKRLENRHHHPEASPFYPMPTGTNLLDAQQATEMVRHMVDGIPDDAQPAPKYDLRAFARFLYEHCALDPDKAGDVAATILSEYTVWPDDSAAQPPAAPVATKSAPEDSAPHNSGERLPSSDAATAGADTQCSAGIEPAKYDMRALAKFLYEHCALTPDLAGEVAATLLEEYNIWPDDFTAQPQIAWQSIETAPFVSAKRYLIVNASEIPVIGFRYYPDGPWYDEHGHSVNPLAWQELPSYSLPRPEQS